MAPLARRRIAAGTAAFALALAALAHESAAPAAAFGGWRLLDTLVLLRDGHGALDWLLPHFTGDRNER